MDSRLLTQRERASQYNQERQNLLASFCSPLKRYFNVDFGWTNYTLNSAAETTGYSIILTDTQHLNLYLFKSKDNGKCFTQAIKETPLDTYSYFLWPNHDKDECPLSQMMSQELSIIRELAIYKRHKKSVDVWFFPTNNHNSSIPNAITKESVSLFLDFVRHFDETLGANERDSLPFVEYISPFDMSYNNPVGKVKDFKFSISSNKFILRTENETIFVSKREWECLSQLAYGKTHKQIANILSISPRTVESYLNQIKDKTGVSYKSNLIDLFHKNTSLSGFI